MDIFVARQPIFNSKKEVFGYELLYRRSTQNFYDAQYGDQATSEVIINSFFMMGIENLTGGKRAFINFTENFLTSEIVSLLPKDLVAVEILENIEVNENLLKICQRMKQQGYMLVLDDFTRKNNSLKQLTKLTDIIKVDFKNTSPAEREEIVKELKSRQITFLAEKVETLEEYQQAVDLGYDLFQGYFFCKPVILSGKKLSGDKINYLQIMTEVNKPDFDFDRIENVLKRDVAISYKLLKYVNSAYMGSRREFNSIKQALILLGLVEFKRWLSLIIYGVLAEGKPNEIIRTCALRAKFGELVIIKGEREVSSSEVFLMGMLSAIDTILETPMSDILSNLPVSTDIKQALVDKSGPLRDYYELILAYERGDWAVSERILVGLNISPSTLAEAYMEAVKWTNKQSGS